MPPNDPRSGLLSKFVSPETQPAQHTGGLEQEVIDGYMTLTPGEKKVLLKAMDGAFGRILTKVLPDQLGALIQEAIDTPPERIGAGTTLPRTGAR